MPDLQFTSEQLRGRRGRPPARERHAPVMVWLPQRVHDRLIRLADRHETTVSGMGRALLVKLLDSGRRM